MENYNYNSDIVVSNPGNGLMSTPQMSIANLEPIAINQISNRAAGKLSRRVEMEAAQEYCKARLVHTVITNTVALSAVTDNAAALVPSSEQTCREVVRTYALSSAKRIAERW